MIFEQIPDEPLEFYLFDGDLVKYNNLYINSDEGVIVDELSKLMFGPESDNKPSELHEDILIKAPFCITPKTVDDKELIQVIHCGFIN